MHSFGALPDGFVMTGNSGWSTRNSELDPRGTLADIQLTDKDRDRIRKQAEQVPDEEEHWYQPRITTKPKYECGPHDHFYDTVSGWTQEAKDLLRHAIESGLIKKAGHDETEFMLHRYSEMKRLKMYG